MIETFQTLEEMENWLNSIDKDITKIYFIDKVELIVKFIEVEPTDYDNG